MLKGKFRDETGDRLTPSHTWRRGKKLTYYVSNRLISGGTDPTGWRLPAEAFEAVVVSAVADHLEDLARGHRLLASADAATSRVASKTAETAASRIRSEGIAVALPLVIAGQVERGRLMIDLNRKSLAELIDVRSEALADASLVVAALLDCRRRGVEMKIVAGDRARSPDPAMLRGLRNAHRWRDYLKSGASLRQLAKTEDVSDACVARIIPLAGLSPKIQTAIAEGSQPLDLTLECLVRTRLPLDWYAQERMFGFAC